MRYLKFDWFVLCLPFEHCLSFDWFVYVVMFVKFVLLNLKLKFD